MMRLVCSERFSVAFLVSSSYVFHLFLFVFVCGG